MNPAAAAVANLLVMASSGRANAFSLHRTRAWPGQFVSCMQRGSPNPEEPGRDAFNGGDGAAITVVQSAAVDLEYNQPSGTIIQVGVAIGSAAQNQQHYIVRRWNLQVDEPISEFITQLTGITNQDCSAGVSLAQCAQELGDLLREQEVFVNPVTWGGGDSADLLRTFAQAEIEFHHFGRRWIDVKTWTILLSLARTRTATIQHGGLSKAMARYKLQFVGKAHRADIDAFNTLRLFFAILERQRTLEGCISQMKNL